MSDTYEQDFQQVEVPKPTQPHPEAKHSSQVLAAQVNVSTSSASANEKKTVNRNNKYCLFIFRYLGSCIRTFMMNRSSRRRVISIKIQFQ
jgi:hypothetical protein